MASREWYREYFSSDRESATQWKILNIYTRSSKKMFSISPNRQPTNPPNQKTIAPIFSVPVLNVLSFNGGTHNNYSIHNTIDADYIL